MVRGILLTANLPQLQNLIKRDPASYKEEFLQQWNHYNSIRQIFQINPDEQAQHFRELVTFISQVWIRRRLNVALGAERLAGRTMLS
jgi:protein SDA1